MHYSSESVSPWNDSEEFYPQCESCSEKSKIPKVKAQRKKTSNSFILDLYVLYGHVTILKKMNNENEEHTLIKILKFLDGKLNSYSA